MLGFTVSFFFSYEGLLEVLNSKKYWEVVETPHDGLQDFGIAEMNTEPNKLHDFWRHLQFFQLTADFPQIWSKTRHVMPSQPKPSSIHVRRAWVQFKKQFNLPTNVTVEDRAKPFRAIWPIRVVFRKGEKKSTSKLHRKIRILQNWVFSPATITK